MPMYMLCGSCVRYVRKDGAEKTQMISGWMTEAVSSAEAEGLAMRALKEKYPVNKKWTEHILSAAVELSREDLLAWAEKARRQKDIST